MSNQSGVIGGACLPPSLLRRCKQDWPFNTGTQLISAATPVTRIAFALLKFVERTKDDDMRIPKVDQLRGEGPFVPPISQVGFASHRRIGRPRPREMFGRVG